MNPLPFTHLPKFKVSDRELQDQETRFLCVWWWGILCSDICTLKPILLFGLQFNDVFFCKNDLFLIGLTGPFVYSISFSILSNPESSLNFHRLADTQARQKRPYRSLNMENLIKPLDIPKSLLCREPQAMLKVEVALAPFLLDHVT